MSRYIDLDQIKFSGLVSYDDENNALVGLADVKRAIAIGARHINGKSGNGQLFDIFMIMLCMQTVIADLNIVVAEKIYTVGNLCLKKHIVTVLNAGN